MKLLETRTRSTDSSRRQISSHQEYTRDRDRSGSYREELTRVKPKVTDRKGGEELSKGFRW